MPGLGTSLGRGGATTAQQDLANADAILLGAVALGLIALFVLRQAHAADLDQANSNAISAQSLLPDIQRAAARFQRLAEDDHQVRVLG